jgi:hypothetical protein
MATRDEVFVSKYLKPADLKGRPHVVEIEGCWQENLKANDGKERNKTIVKFAGKNKTLVMNMSNGTRSPTSPARPTPSIGRAIRSRFTRPKPRWAARPSIASGSEPQTVRQRKRRHRRHVRP